MLLTKILLATDGSAEAQRAARMAISLSQSLGSGLHVLCVGSVPSAYSAAESEILDYEFYKEMREFAHNAASQTLGEEVRKIEDSGSRVEMAHAAVGRPDAEIVRIAEEIGADVVIVGSRGLGPLRRALMGSVSNSVVRHAHSSVLVVRGKGEEESKLPGKILLALDGSKEAGAAEQIAAEISSATGSELHLVRDLDTEASRPYPGPEFWEGFEEDLERSKRNVKTFLEEHANRLEAEGVKVGDVHLAFGEADREIVRIAEEMRADLIVVGSRGLGGIRRALIGSVSDSVVRHAHCPVLVVRQRRSREPAAQRWERVRSDKATDDPRDSAVARTVEP
jgi:nucleotide-binding universal stress UspA family protein